MNRVLVTGATGFIGRRLTDRLLRDGWMVRALSRTSASQLDRRVESISLCDIDDHDALAAAVRDTDVVLHLAARVHVMREKAGIDPVHEFKRANVDFTRHLANAAAAASVRQFVLASSVKAVGESGLRAMTAATTPHPVDPYGISKHAAESVVRSTSESSAMRSTIMRFPLVYGPGVKANFHRLIRVVDRGLPLPFGAVHNRRSLLYVENAVDAIVSAIDAQHGKSTTYFVSDGDPVSTPQLIREIARALGRTAVLVPLPPTLFRWAGRAGDAIHQFVPAFPVTSAAIDRVVGSLEVDSVPLWSMAGHAAPFSFREGIEATIAAYRSAQASV